MQLCCLLVPYVLHNINDLSIVYLCSCNAEKHLPPVNVRVACKLLVSNTMEPYLNGKVLQ